MGIDVNAFSPRWHDHRRNEKGRIVENMVTDLGLIILIRPDNDYTFQGVRGRSNVDVTMASPSIIQNIRDWRVIKGTTTSDHLMICFTITDQVRELRFAPKVRYSDHKIDKPSFVIAVRNALESLQCDDSINGLANHILLSLSSACEQRLPKFLAIKPIRPPWWNADITNSRRELKHAHRMMLRLKTPDSRVSFKKARNEHMGNIRRAKKAIWQRFAEDSITSGNTWGNLTKWLIKGKRDHSIPSVLRKGDGTYTSFTGDTVSYMLDELIPTSAHDPRT